MRPASAGDARAASATIPRGIALVTAMIVLAAMSLAAAALMRAVDTVTAVTGNLAFRAASIPAADAAIEEAIAALGETGVIADPERDLPAQNYYANRQSGEDARGVPWVLQKPDRYPAEARVLDAGDGNVLRFIIERLCLGPGPATLVNCALAQPPAATDETIAGAPAPPHGPPLLRITVRVDGPQGANSFVQAIVRDTVSPRRLSWRTLTD